MVLHLKDKFLLRVIATLLFSAFFSRGMAQGYSEGANLSYDLIPLKVNTPAGSEAFNANDFKLTGIIPVYLKKDSSRYLLFGLNLEAMSFPGAHPAFPVADVYGISPVLGYGRAVSKKLSLSLVFLPFLNSDLSTVQSSDIHFAVVVRGVYHARENISVKVTLGYRKQFYGTQYIVFLGLDWKLSNRWRLFGELPNNGTLNYSLRPRINAGLNFLAGNTSYHLTNQNHYLQYNFAQPGIFAEYYLTPMLAIRGTIAYSYLRNLDIYNMNEKVSGVVDYIVLGSQPTALNPEVSNGPAFKLSLSLRIPEGK